MSLIIHAHPFSSYCQKALIALYENDTPFLLHLLDRPASFAALKVLWPHGTFPVLVDKGVVIPEATIIIEHLALHHPGPVRLIPADPAAALPIRLLDRYFDNNVMTPMQKIVGDALRAEGEHDPKGVAEAQLKLDVAYDRLEATLPESGWITGTDFTLADCAAAPALFYADWVRPIGDRRPRLSGYRARLLARPSFARAVDEARPYRAGFPLGAPDRD